MDKEISGYREMIVEMENTAHYVGSGDLDVFATPSLIALIEGTAAKSVEKILNKGESTVGTLVNVKHIAPTPVGMKVRCETRLVDRDRKKLVFDVKVFDEKTIICEGVHERFIINSEKFIKKAMAKL